MASAKPYLIVGLRGSLALADDMRDADELEEDVSGLVVTRSQVLGFAEFAGDRHAIEHWRHCDAGGTFTPNGEEDLVGWLQVDVRVGAASERPSAHEPKRLLPVTSTLSVLRDALEHLGTLTLTEADAIVPLGLMADPISRVAAGRDWLQTIPCRGPRRELVVTIEAGGSRAKLAGDRLADGMALLGEELLGPIAMRCVDAPDRRAEFLRHRFSRGAFELQATTPLWSVDFAAWAIELAARTCHALGVRESVLVSVRCAPS